MRRLTRDIWSQAACTTPSPRLRCCSLITAISALIVCSWTIVEHCITMRKRVKVSVTTTKITLLQRQNFDSISLTTTTTQLVQAPVYIVAHDNFYQLRISLETKKVSFNVT